MTVSPALIAAGSAAATNDLFLRVFPQLRRMAQEHAQRR